MNEIDHGGKVGNKEGAEMIFLNGAFKIAFFSSLHLYF